VTGRLTVIATALLLAACGAHSAKKVIVIGVDGMDPGFVERHWIELPHLRRLAFARLATTTPPQSPVAWSTFMTGLDPADHGIFDFVHRDPATHELFLSTDRIVGPRFRLPLGPYELPLSASRVESLRHGTAFWQTLSEHGVPVTIVHVPANYPPLPFGNEISGMETPDLRGTQSTFSFYTDDPAESTRAVSGGLIRKAELKDGHVVLEIEGPPNSLRKDGAYATAPVTVDVDAERPVARFEAGGEMAVLKEGEWSGWIPLDFPLLSHLVSVRGMVRIFVKRLHPRFEVYVSPVNIDPQKPALPISSPASFAASLAASFGKDMGRFYTVGIAEDTSALRQGVFSLPEFLAQSREVLKDERRLLDKSLDRFEGGFLFFYFSSVDQNSHVLWGRHDAELAEFYRAIDAAVGEVARREPDAQLIVMSDHGFSAFDRAVNLNTWLLEEGLLARDASGGIDWANTKAYAMGLNALYLNGADLADVRRRLLALRDPSNGRAVVETATAIHAAPENRRVAPDLVVGYSPGYRASWQTGLGEVPETVFEDNTDAWIADHCINAADVPGVLFTSPGIVAPNPSLKSLSRVILGLFGE
jgi:predicted AlkP superfamily phosphohydrolase/phosphomutase